MSGLVRIVATKCPECGEEKEPRSWVGEIDRIIRPLEPMTAEEIRANRWGCEACQHYPILIVTVPA